MFQSLIKKKIFNVDSEQKLDDQELCGEDPAMILYTSGTTGPPKV